MLVRFFFLLRQAGIPVSITELLTLLEALEAGLAELSAERFYFLALILHQAGARQEIEDRKSVV